MENGKEEKYSQDELKLRNSIALLKGLVNFSKMMNLSEATVIKDCCKEQRGEENLTCYGANVKDKDACPLSADLTHGCYEEALELAIKSLQAQLPD